MTARTPQRSALIALLEPVVSGLEYDLEDVSVTAAGRRSVIRVVVDGDGGIDLDAVAEVSRAISDTLDEGADGGPAFAGPYVLEVTSPGVDRPLTEPRHWRRALGRLVSVPVGEQTLTGRVTSADDIGIHLLVGDTDRSLGYSELGRGKVQVEFARPGSEPDEEDSDVEAEPTDSDSADGANDPEEG